MDFAKTEELPSTRSTTIADSAVEDSSIPTDQLKGDLSVVEVQPNEKGEVAESSTAPALPTFPDGGLRAWLVIAGVASLNFGTFGLAVSWGAFQAYYEQTLLKDHSSSSIAWIGSLQFALIFMPGSVTGRLLDMGYYKLPLAIASVVLVVCAMLTAQCREYWQFLLCQGIGLGLASGFIFPATLGLVSQWFHARRALAFGVTACGTSLGGIIIPIMIRLLLPSVGFPWTARIVAFVVALALGLGFIATRTRLPPRPVKKMFTLEVLRSRNLWLYCAASFFGFLGMFTPLTFLAVSAVQHGIPSDLSFYIVAITNGASIVGRLTAGVLGDRYGPLNMIAPFTLLAAVMTFAWPYANNLGGYIAVSIIYGISFGAYVGLLPSPAASLGPMHSVGERIGLQLTLMSFAILLGPPISGAIRSASKIGGFEAAGAYAGATIVVGALFMLLTKRSVTGAWFTGKI